MQKKDEQNIAPESTELAVREADEPATGQSEELMVVDSGPVSRRSRADLGTPIGITEIHEMDAERMGGGYASVVGESKPDNKLVWIVLAVMCVMCILVGILSSLLTAHFMKKGDEPPTIGTNDSVDAFSAVAAIRKPSVVEISCGKLHGSGVIMKFEGSKVYVLTNAHVLDGFSTPAVRFYGEDEYYDGATVGYNGFYDVAVLTVAYSPKYAVYDLGGSEFFSPTREFAEGDGVIAIGNAMGMGIAVYDGIISKKSDVLKYGDKLVPVTRTTAAINAGMSGGALFDAEGYFIGLGTYRMSSTDESGSSHSATNDVEDTGFVTPVSIVYSVYKQILGFGDVGETSMLNMSVFQTATSAKGGINIAELGLVCELRGDALTVVSTDMNGVPADIAAGDVITHIGAVELKGDLCETVGELLKFRRNAYTGTKLRLTLSRGGATVVAEYDGIYNYVG